MEAEAAYVAAHGRRLEAALSEAVSAAIAAHAANPVRYISEHLQKAATAEKTQQAGEENSLLRVTEVQVTDTADAKNTRAAVVEDAVQFTTPGGALVTLRLSAGRLAIYCKRAGEEAARDADDVHSLELDLRVLALEAVQRVDLEHEVHALPGAGHHAVALAVQAAGVGQPRVRDGEALRRVRLVLRARRGALGHRHHHLLVLRVLLVGVLLVGEVGRGRVGRLHLVLRGNPEGLGPLVPRIEAHSKAPASTRRTRLS
jgi:hypothetical protein